MDPDPIRVRIILQDPDPNRHPGHSDPDPADPDQYRINSKHICFLTFFMKISIHFPELKIITHLPLMGKKNIVNWHYCE
jgi:hypothetical protein